MSCNLFLLIVGFRNTSDSSAKDERVTSSAQLSAASPAASSADNFFIDVILNRHAKKLLSSYRIRDLAKFAANLDDYELVQWLRKERCVSFS